MNETPSETQRKRRGAQRAIKPGALKETHAALSLSLASAVRMSSSDFSSPWPDVEPQQKHRVVKYDGGTDAPKTTAFVNDHRVQAI